MKKEPFCLIIPAAGLGTRMQPVNAEIPKEMLPVGNKPAIQYAVEEGFSSGIRDIIIVINRKKEIVRRYFEDTGYRKKLFPRSGDKTGDIINACAFTFLYQEKPLGESDALGVAGDTAGGRATAVIYPDNIYFPAPGALKRLVPVFRKYNSDVCALMEVTDKNARGISNSGRADIEHLEGNVFRIKKIHTKGRGFFVPRFKGELRTCGISVSGPHLFDYIERLRHKIKKREFTDGPVRRAVAAEKGLLGYRLQGTVFDIGNPRGYGLCLEYIKARRR